MNFLLEVEGLSGAFHAPNGDVTPVLHEVSFGLRAGATTAIVGETGSGKSLTALSILGIPPASFTRTAGCILFDGAELDATRLGAIRGRRISMVFQDARSALNPVFTVGRQMADVHQLHHVGSAGQAMEAAIEALGRVA
ncbi:MAG: ATP-binding cassette domain-containing protein, partial [Roseococcus sp.]